MNVKRKIFTDRLSGVPCTPEMRSKVEQKAKELDCSKVELQRAAIAFFLLSNVKNIDIISQEYVQEGVVPDTVE